MSAKWLKLRHRCRMLFAAAKPEHGLGQFTTREPRLLSNIVQSQRRQSGRRRQSTRFSTRRRSPPASRLDTDLVGGKVVMQRGFEPAARAAAVAQMSRNRVGQGSIGDSVCAVVNRRASLPPRFLQSAATIPGMGQRGRGRPTGMAGDAEQCGARAVFYHCASQAPNRFFRSASAYRWWATRRLSLNRARDLDESPGRCAGAFAFGVAADLIANAVITEGRGYRI